MCWTERKEAVDIQIADKVYKLVMPWFIQLIMAVFMIILYIAIFMVVPVIQINDYFIVLE